MNSVAQIVEITYLRPVSFLTYFNGEMGLNNTQNTDIIQDQF